MAKADPSVGAASGPDAEALRASLSTRCRVALNAFFRRRTPDPAEAEDLAQEVLPRVVRRNDGAAMAEPDAYIFETACTRDHILPLARTL